MEAVGITVFRANLMDFIKRVQKGEAIIITSRGRQVARLVPPIDKREKAREALKKLRKTAVVGDVLSPVDEEWESMQ